MNIFYLKIKKGKKNSVVAEIREIIHKITLKLSFLQQKPLRSPSEHIHRVNGPPYRPSIISALRQLLGFLSEKLHPPHRPPPPFSAFVLLLSSLYASLILPLSFQREEKLPPCCPGELPLVPPSSLTREKVHTTS